MFYLKYTYISTWEMNIAVTHIYKTIAQKHLVCKTNAERLVHCSSHNYFFFIICFPSSLLFFFFLTDLYRYLSRSKQHKSISVSTPTSQASAYSIWLKNCLDSKQKIAYALQFGSYQKNSFSQVWIIHDSLHFFFIFSSSVCVYFFMTSHLKFSV